MELTVIENKEYNIYNNVKKYILEGKNKFENGRYVEKRKGVIIL